MGLTISSTPPYPPHPGEGWPLKTFCYNGLACDYVKYQIKQNLFSFQERQLFFFLACNISTQLNTWAYIHIHIFIFPGGGGGESDFGMASKVYAYSTLSTLSERENAEEQQQPDILLYRQVCRKESIKLQ